MNRNQLIKPSRSRVGRSLAMCGLLAAGFLAVGAAPARADFCILLNGDGFWSSGLAFLRFNGDVPTVKGTMTPLAGRISGVGPVYGTAVIPKNNADLEIGGTFYFDSVPGQFDLTFDPPKAKNGTGYAGYGVYGIPDPVTAKIVGCGQEPSP